MVDRMQVKIWAVSSVVFLGLMIGSAGCSSKKEKAAEIDDDMNQIINQLDTAQKPYTGKLTPKEAALITHEVSTQSMKAFPIGTDMPKDPKELLKLNEKIRVENEAIYKKHGTTMDEVTHYISQLTPKDREKYNKLLSELFLEQSRKKYGKQQEKPDTDSEKTPDKDQATKE